MRLYDTPQPCQIRQRCSLFMESPFDVSETMFALGEAAERLGVHPVTLRRWSESGKIRSVRTPGGHRRFPESEIRRLTGMEKEAAAQDRDWDGDPDHTADGSRSGDTRSEEEDGTRVSSLLRDSALESTRRDLRGDQQASWARDLAPEDREEKRLLGRRLMGLMMQYVSRNEEDGSEVLQEARVIGRIYAKSIIQSGLSLSEALKATMFFRDHIVESAVILPETANRRPESNQRMFRRLNSFLNEIQLVITEAYEDRGRGQAE